MLRLTAIASLALFLQFSLSSCTKPPLDSYCEKYQTKDFTDPGIRLQNAYNKRADLANANTYERDCVTSPPHDR